MINLERNADWLYLEQWDRARNPKCPQCGAYLTAADIEGDCDCEDVDAARYRQIVGWDE